MPVTLLLEGEVLRLKGISKEHVRVLAESDEPLPPILVQRRTMRVIDGMHRIAAAKLCGRETIHVRFFDGDPEEAFVEAVQANSTHGLPLTLADRKAAAARILRSRGEWSDRRIAGLVALSPKTVGVVRGGLTEEVPQLTVRVGRDGRVRRLPARETEDQGITPSADAQGIHSGVTGADSDSSLGLARSLRPTSTQAPSEARPRASSSLRCRTAMQLLRQDPSLRMTEVGRFLLRLLDLHLRRTDEWDRLLEHVPPHRAKSVADLAAECAQTWLDFAKRVSSHEC